MMEFTPHPLVTLIVDHMIMTKDKVHVVSAVMEYPQPVSVNELYTNGKYGQKVLTSAGRAYKDGLCAAVSRSSFEWKRGIDMVYQEGAGATLLVVLYFEQLWNKSWKPGSVTESGSPKQPRTVKDASNYIKIVEDGVAEGTGINDCNNINILVSKVEDKVRPRTELVYIVA